ncbi:isoaspartyl peptidase/L-asparaginase family protein [Vibrio sp. RC27]
MQTPFSIAIHGGAGTIEPSMMSKELQQEIERALTLAVTSGHSVLNQGGTAIDAVVSAVKCLEDSPHFNAGHGSVLTHQEMVEMDAAVMLGDQRQAGAVAGVKHIRNPVELAKDVMEKTPHVLLAGKGAEEFAFSLGYDYTEQDYFFTERRYQQLQSMKEKGLFALSESKYPDDKKFGTVGAVALDQYGNLAAATSTGGVTNKKYGRIGDSPLIGSGTYAENKLVALSASGMGEAFIRHCVTADIAARMRYLKEDVSEACDAVLHGELCDIGGEGGVIAIDAQGKIHFSLNSSGMYRASIDRTGELKLAIYSNN